MLKVLLMVGALSAGALGLAGTAAAECTETASPVQPGSAYTCVLEYDAYESPDYSYENNVPLRANGYQGVGELWTSVNAGVYQGSYDLNWGTTSISGYGTGAGASYYNSLVGSGGVSMNQNTQSTTYTGGSYESRSTDIFAGASDANYNGIFVVGVSQQESQFNSGSCCPPYKGTFITAGQGGRDGVTYRIVFASHDNQPCHMELRGPNGTTDLGPCPADVPSVPDVPTFPRPPN